LLKTVENAETHLFIYFAVLANLIFWLLIFIFIDAAFPELGEYL